GRAAEHLVLERHRLVDRDVVLHLAAGTEHDTRADHDVLPEDAARAEPRAGRDVAEMPDLAAGADLGARVDDGARMQEVIGHGRYPFVVKSTGARVSSARWQ